MVEEKTTVQRFNLGDPTSDVIFPGKEQRQ